MGSLREAQMQMASHLRHPAKHPAPAGVEERRLKIYRDLIYNNIENFISSGFPVLRSLYTSEQWEELVRGFMDSHRCHTPLFPEISQEFLHYLMREHRARDCDPPFLLELAHYEWVELALDVAVEELPSSPADPDPGNHILYLSPLAWVLAYQFPVHRVGREFQPDAALPTWLAVYRDCGDAVRFLQLTAASARLLELLRDNLAPTDEVLGLLARELDMPFPTVRQYALEELQQMLASGVVFAR